MARLVLAALVGLGLVVLAGCGGGIGGAGGGVMPPPSGGDAATVQVGPLLVRPASAAGFVAQELHSEYGQVSLVALHGSRVNYLASQALLDRIVFSRGSGLDYDLCVCNLDGSGAVRLIDNAASDWAPAWSPDGARIAFQRTRVAEDAEIVVMNANGSDPRALTANAADDQHPTWSPEGRRIAFQTNRDGNQEIYVMYDDGSGATNLTNHGSGDISPDWSPSFDDAMITFVSARDDAFGEIYTMHDDGSSPTRLTTNTTSDLYPAYDQTGSRIAWQSIVQGLSDILVREGGGAAYNLSGAPGAQQYPAWSSDGRFVCYSSNAGGSYGLVLQQTEPPYDQFAVTHNAATNLFPDLGSPTMQTDRVVIGPSGADWGGRDPIWSYSDAGVVAFSEEGYRNFVRIAVRPADLPSLQVSPLTQPAAFMVGPGEAPLGVLVEANEIVSLREDGGRGRDTMLWQLDPLDATAAALYFDSWTGKLVAVLTIADQNYPSATVAPGAAVTRRTEGGATVVEGSFGAVFDASGARLADAASAVSIADGAVSVVR